MRTNVKSESYPTWGRQQDRYYRSCPLRSSSSSSESAPTVVNNGNKRFLQQNRRECTGIIPSTSATAIDNDVNVPVVQMWLSPQIVIFVFESAPTLGPPLSSTITVPPAKSTPMHRQHTYDTCYRHKLWPQRHLACIPARTNFDATATTYHQRLSRRSYWPNQNGQWSIIMGNYELFCRQLMEEASPAKWTLAQTHQLIPENSYLERQNKHSLCCHHPVCVNIKTIKVNLNIDYWMWIFLGHPFCE